MHQKINLILDVLALEEELNIQEKPIPKDEVIYLDEDAYKQMCKLIGEGTIPFMGIA